MSEPEYPAIARDPEASGWLADLAQDRIARYVVPARNPFPDSGRLSELVLGDVPQWPKVSSGVTWVWAGNTEQIVWYGEFGKVSLKKHCRVYWGTHGCDLHRGHRNLCECDCCDCVNHPDPESGCVARSPYYGPDTRFYGEDVAARGLPMLEDAR